ncbi:hypothetical protein BD414DRAFT_488817 [Trametes punicea]|nr:hypothetical protein BD414DRAFT_488817 [Trametes punicea]
MTQAQLVQPRGYSPSARGANRRRDIAPGGCHLVSTKIAPGTALMSPAFSSLCPCKAVLVLHAPSYRACLMTAAIPIFRASAFPASPARPLCESSYHRSLGAHAQRVISSIAARLASIKEEGGRHRDAGSCERSQEGARVRTDRLCAIEGPGADGGRSASSCFSLGPRGRRRRMGQVHGRDEEGQKREAGPVRTFASSADRSRWTLWDRAEEPSALGFRRSARARRREVDLSRRMPGRQR